MLVFGIEGSKGKHVQDTYGEVIQKIVAGLVPRDQIDQTAQDRADYRSELWLAAWEAQTRFRRKSPLGGGQIDDDWERRYVFRALWNASLLCRRRRRNLVRVTDSTERTIDYESQYQAAEVLGLLERRLGRENFSVLRRLGEAGGVIERARVPSDGNYDSFRRRVRVLRKKARKILGHD